MTIAVKTRVTALTLVSVALVAPLSPPARAQESLPVAESQRTIGIALTDAPVEARTDPRAYRYVVGHLPAGSTTTRRLEVSNDTDSDRRIEIYAGPATVHGGRFLPTEPGSVSDLTRWITVDKPVVRLPPHSTTEVEVAISAPRDAPSVEQYGVIWASHTSRASSTTGDGPAATRAGSPTGSGGLDAISRVGVRVYLSTGGEHPPDSDFRIVDLRPIRDALGAAALVATVANTGGRAVDIAGTLALTDGPGGLSAPPVAADPVTVGPGETAEVPFNLPPGAAVPSGEWLASLALSSGVVKRETVESISFAPINDRSGSAAAPTNWTLPAGLLLPGLALAALVLGAAGWRAVLRRRR